MAKKSFNVEVEPEVVEWAIESSGWTVEELSEKLRISENTINGWIDGRKQPTMKQLENLSKYLKRPIAVFFLVKPPEEKPLPKDYRMISGKEGVFDKKTILAIRTARRLQNVSKELTENIHIGLKIDISSANLTDDPKKIAERFRNNFQITEETQKKWKNPREAFDILREHIGKRNIFVFQIPMPMEDARGFALVDDVPPVIVVNSKEDQIEARIFTLTHEFAHVLLHKSGIDMPENSLLVNDVDVDKVERWCNEFASAFLLPESMAIKVFTKHRETLIETPTLNKLSRRYKVSKGMLLYNMRKLNYITNTQYKEVLERYKQIQKESEEEKMKYLFSWDDVPGKDSKRLLKYLWDNLKMGWARNAEIKKSDNGKVITIINRENSLRFKLKGKEGKVILEISDSKTKKYILKKEEGKLNVYLQKGGGPTPDIRCISEKGKKFISIVSANLENNFITNRDALDYLSIKSRHYDKILPKIRG